MNVLNAKQIAKTFTLEKKDITILKNISLTIKKGEFVAIMGSSGSGKTTLLSILAGLDKPSTGTIELNEKDITQLSEDQLATLRNKDIGFVFQSFHLIPSITALENVMFPLELQKDKQARQKATELLKKVGLSHRIDHFPHQLSGGEQQRVALARALIHNPNIIFADEPTGNLDSENGKAIIDLLLNLQKTHEAALVVVTHENELAQKADRIIRLKDGQIA